MLGFDQQQQHAMSTLSNGSRCRHPGVAAATQEVESMVEAANGHCRYFGPAPDN